MAIVGENGAGKSTLLKLMLGLYKPGVGTMSVGVLDTSQVHGASLLAIPGYPCSLV